jgi:hypothetical protein
MMSNMSLVDVLPRLVRPILAVLSPMILFMGSTAAGVGGCSAQHGFQACRFRRKEILTKNGQDD